MLIVKTTGPFTLYDPAGQIIQRRRPSVVRNTRFINDRCATQQVEILRTDLPEAANDADFAKYWEEAPEIAIEAYVASFAPEAEAPAPTPAPAPKARGRSK
ncbi:hypothetical protein [Inquilinus limosus]|uniref:hypothetical protein n=1 Tax=Inquilinus limosus TaxID=171674 RepID=UPI00054E5220|nr:hypothetical protein [Inquilinus limosus]